MPRRGECEHVFVSSEATILHADLDAFYASVEQRDDPRLRGRPGDRRRRASCSRRATRPRRTASARAMGGAQARRLCPRRDRRAAAHVGLLRGEQGGLRGLRRHDAARRGALDRRGVPRRRAGCGGSRARRPRSPRGCGGEVRERVGLPITVGVARTKFLAKVASGVAKPDGLLVVPPDGELEFLHPLPVERLWGVGPGDRGEAARPRDHAPSARSRGSPRRRWSSMLGRGVRPAPARARAQPRPAAGAGRPAAALDRLAARARPPAPLAGGARRRSLVGARRPGHPPAARGRPGRPHRRAAAALRRLHARDPLAHAAAGRPRETQTILAAARGLLARRDADDRARRAHAVGISLTNLDDDGADPARAAVRARAPRRARRRARRGARPVRHRRAITRAVLLGRDQGLSVPLLPD